MRKQRVYWHCVVSDRKGTSITGACVLFFLREGSSVAVKGVGVVGFVHQQEMSIWET